MLPTRKEAIEKGLPRYAGKVCQTHPLLMGERYTNSGACIVCMCDTVKRYQAKNREAIHVRNKKYRTDNPDKVKGMHQAWRHINAERDATRKVQYRVKNATKVKAAYKRYYEANYPRMLAKRNRQHADKLKRTPSWLTCDDHWMIELAYELAALRTKVFGFPWHVDHVIPLRGKKVSGLHVPTNLQVVPWLNNLKKTNKFEVA